MEDGRFDDAAWQERLERELDEVDGLKTWTVRQAGGCNPATCDWCLAGCDETPF
jgi:hypothetical protein